MQTIEKHSMVYIFLKRPLILIYNQICLYLFYRDKMVSLAFAELVVIKELVVSPVNLAQLVSQDLKDHPDLPEPLVRSAFWWSWTQSE